jgi:hypothetical protein
MIINKYCEAAEVSAPCCRDWADIVLNKVAKENRISDDEFVRGYHDPAVMAREIQKVSICLVL